MRIMLDAAGWTAVGTFTLAGGTFVLATVTVRTAQMDRRHDDAKRAEDRDLDAARRAEDRARDAQLRKEIQDEAERRATEEQRARDDFEARQVLVSVEMKERSDSGHNFTRRVILSAPHSYPIKQVEGRFVVPSAGWSVIEFGHIGDEPKIDEDRVFYSFWAEVPAGAFGATPIMRFLDWHGHRYYQYRHYTERFADNVDWLEAVWRFRHWIGEGVGDGDAGPLNDA
jgi:hypothetical protein